MENEITKERIEKAIERLYGSMDAVSSDSMAFLSGLLDNGNYEKVYEEVRRNERLAKEILVEFEQQYPETLKTENVQDILNTLRAKKGASPKK